ncbi:MerR family transcriptional regulator [Serinibacter arcticus]|uniref:MerR family transcriptional regulator n=1 Tax=Serinibacter arcticus TaxID=1655435 RepID=A0A2U1ZUP5_9MICO|nr:MerR family transcriptional regulator [Serinibacter arcticus]PWD50706.1 MerR family transcriptional regulator [Serinibacter arcticus]
MHSSFIPPRQVQIGDAATFVGTTPRAIRHYHEIGLLPEPERGSDDRRRYRYDDMIQLLWIRKMADAGVALDDIREALAHPAAAGSSREDADDVLERLETTLLAREAALQRQRTAVQRMRRRGSRLGLLSDVVAGRLENLPAGALRQSDLDNLLVTERILGPLVAALQTTRIIALAASPALQEESDRVDAAEESLDDTVAVDDPRVALVAAERCAFEQTLNAAIEASGLAQEEDALLDSWDALHPADGAAADQDPSEGRRSLSALEAIGLMPYDLSPARLRSMELAEELAVQGLPAS